MSQTGHCVDQKQVNIIVVVDDSGVGFTVYVPAVGLAADSGK